MTPRQEDAPLEAEGAGSLPEPETDAANEPAADVADTLSDLTQLYLHEIGAKPLLDAYEQRADPRAAVAGDFAARQTMIERNLRLVVNIAKH